mmetsp:Transcript_34001/g.82400  ORF Transcript_34001/g.82400 Transcript_34001/m.82400 type:complete len:175 (-) Transcript_34001:1156-1680(-)
MADPEIILPIKIASGLNSLPAVSSGAVVCDKKAVVCHKKEALLRNLAGGNEDVRSTTAKIPSRKRDLDHHVPSRKDKKVKTIHGDMEELKVTRVTVTGLGFYVHNFDVQPARGAEATLNVYKYMGQPAVAVMVNGKKYASVKKEFVDLVIGIINGPRYVRARFPNEYTHIRHRS